MATPRTRTLVLGGGGVTGIAWELGLLKGLRDAALDLTGADSVIGTSAGSVVGTQITTGPGLDELYAAQTRPPGHEIGAALGKGALVRMVTLMVLPGDSRTRRRRLGRASVKAHPTQSDERLAVIRSRIGDPEWPDRDLRVTAVEAETGEFVVFDSHTGIRLVEAVTASCAVPLVWPPVRVGGRLYVDGGVRSSANADLASGTDSVVVIAPIPRSASRRHSLAAQLGRTGAAHTAVVSPDKDAVSAIGPNPLDPARRQAAAEAGLAQAASVLDAVRSAWS